MLFGFYYDISPTYINFVKIDFNDFSYLYKGK